ncbi:hypothetical protein FRC08_000100 [Ceratobasidium sp. 394]|nr:hypothetical protein FRC08_000100 [Ceratobasidium sp. 394]
MPGDSKKRKLGDEDRISWTKEKAAAFVKDVAEIQEAIRYCNADAFTDNFANLLGETPMDTVQIVKELISPILLDGNKGVKHCVRCHKTYTEADNHYAACIIHCTGPFQPFSLYTSFQSYRMANCCGRVFEDVNSWDYTKVVCIKERHTDDPREVIFFDPNRKHARSKDAAPLGTNNWNVLTCETKGCGKTA